MAYVSLETRGKVARTTPPSFLRKGPPPHFRHLLSAKTIDADHVDELCRAAEAYEFGRAPAAASSGKTVALLFFQPSTRTRMGFEAATIALGCHSIGMDDMSGSRSNARSRETLEDC